MFEGSEKKLEILFSKDSPSLLEKPDGFWNKIVKASGAEILSSLKNPKLQSYILSESSLFLWEHRLVLITCGNTILSRAFLKILKYFPKDQIELCFFQRKNEFFPLKQKSSFYKDLKNIQKKIQGPAYRFGDLHQHHFFLFHNQTDFKPEGREQSPEGLDQTLEILIYDCETLQDISEPEIQKLKKQLNIEFPGFEIQDHVFNPPGYSLNAIKEDFYYSIHWTPEKNFFYISFETNIQNQNPEALTHKILSVFKPKTFDLILFQSSGADPFKPDFPEHSSSNCLYQFLDCSYHVYYYSFYPKQSFKKGAVLLKSPEDLL